MASPLTSDGCFLVVTRLNREIKAHCPDFEPVRRILRESGAVFIEVKRQEDFFYHLPVSDNEKGNRRLKLRVEKGLRQLIYYRDRQEGRARTSSFQLCEVNAPEISDVLKAALGVRAIVRKSRELWCKGNVIFNLDTVEGVGQILEIEVQANEGCDVEAQIREYSGLFGPHLGSYVRGSNEDLVVSTEC